MWTLSKTRWGSLKLSVLKCCPSVIITSTHATAITTAVVRHGCLKRMAMVCFKCTLATLTTVCILVLYTKLKFRLVLFLFWWLQKQTWPYSVCKSGKYSGDLHANLPHWCVLCFYLMCGLELRGETGKVMRVALSLSMGNKRTHSHPQTWVDTGDVLKDATSKWEEII